MSRLVVPLAAVGADDLPLAGGKGMQLGVLLAAGLPVPDGFCVTTHAFRQGRQSMTPEIREAMVAAYRSLGEERVAVRSSATAEDLPFASFAGQQDTFLNVSGTDSVVQAVEDCWRSLFTERAIAYRRDHGIAEDGVAMAVVVQRMVQADAAGVLFTVNPVTGALDELVVEAALGLGDKVVSAQVTPDRYRLRRRAPHALIEREGEETRAVLTPQALAELARLGLAAERLLGRAADIEWAVAGGKAWLLQSRAVTAAGPRLPVVRYGSRWNARQAEGKVVFWSNYNLRDTMPYPHPPFSWSFWNYFIWPSMLRGAGLLREGEDPQELVSVIDQVDGRLYFNLNVGRALFRMPNRLEVRVGGALDAELGPVLKDIFESGELKAFTAPVSLRRGLYALFLARNGFGHTLWKPAAESWKDLEDARTETDHFRQVDPSILSEEQLIAMARYFALENMPRAVRPIIGSLPALIAVQLLYWALPRWKLERLFAPLISGVRGNPTMETALAMWDLAEGAGPETRAAFAREDVADLPAALAHSDDGRAFLACMEEFLRVHGHRAVREFDFCCPRWRDDPTFVYESVRNYLGHPSDQPTPRQHYQRQVEQHEEARRELLHTLRRRPLRRLLARLLVRVIEERMPLREAYKFYVLYGLAHVRDLLLEVGRRQAERGMLERADDYFFLSVPEAEKIARGELNAAWVREQVAVRRREFALYMRSDPPLVVRSDGKPVRQAAAGGEVLCGAGASAGVVRGPARILFDPADGATLRPGEILVARFTDPGWTPLFLTAGGLVMEVGGIISHGAVVAREYGIPAVIGVKHATRLLRDGEMLEVDGSNGEVRRLAAAAATA